MLFVRNDSILETMVKVPLLVAGVIIVIAVMPIQSSFSSPKVLDLIIYPDGSTHVSAEIDVDPLATDYDLDLFGTVIDNFVAVGENGFLLSSHVVEDSAIIETFGSSIITVEYDIHDLVSKQGRIWTFTLDSPIEFTLLLPQNSAIVSMTNLPINMRLIDDHAQLTLSDGNTEINYLFSTVSPVNNSTDTDSSWQDYLTYALIGGVIAAVVTVLMTIRTKKIVKTIPNQQTVPAVQNTIDLETIFKQKPDIRDDDKEIVKFIYNNGRQALESELRKKFLQPRTTMWRAVKRLERNGIVEIEKKDLHNLVKLRNNLEEEQ